MDLHSILQEPVARPSNSSVSGSEFRSGDSASRRDHTSFDHLAKRSPRIDT